MYNPEDYVKSTRLLADRFTGQELPSFSLLKDLNSTLSYPVQMMTYRHAIFTHPSPIIERPNMENLFLFDSTEKGFEGRSSLAASILRHMEVMLCGMHEIVRDFEHIQAEVHDVGAWLVKLEEMLYQLDDVVDWISVANLRQMAMTHSVKGKMRAFCLSQTTLRFSVPVRMLKGIWTQISSHEAIGKSLFHERIKRLPVEIQVREQEPTLTYLLGLDEQVQIFGREKDKEAIIRDLLDYNLKDDIPVIPIIGNGGLGKTTLARLVYNDERVKRNFELQMWVCVSEISDIKRILTQVVESAGMHKVENPDMGLMQNFLRKKIEGTRYLLVLDDLCIKDNKKWLILRHLLMGGAPGSRILITTRRDEVAKVTGAVEQHTLRRLRSVDCWEYFLRMAFGERQDLLKSDAITIGHDIVRVCNGFPLAIRVIARLLQSKSSAEEWRSIMRCELKLLINKIDGEDAILRLLKLSYGHLPSPLKHCFAYCSLFPKNYVIHVPTLVNLWIGQGFIKSSDASKCLEDVGYECFMNLYWRQFFYEVEKDEWGRIRSCKMHNLISDLAISVAGERSMLLNSDLKDVPDGVRHVSFGFSLDQSWQFPMPILKSRLLRTFLLPSQSWPLHEKQFSTSTCDAIFSSFPLLRVLDLQNLGLKKLPSSLGNLLLLRFLDLSRNSMENLPTSVTKLQKLQTLKLSYCHRLKQLPRAINDLVSLRHLDIDGCNDLSHMPSGLGKLTSLQTLSRFVVSKNYNSGSSNIGGLQELRILNNLRGELEIIHLEQLRFATISEATSNLEGKNHLRGLTLSWDDDDGGDVDKDELSLDGLQPHRNLKTLSLMGYRGLKFSSWILTLGNLVKFTMYNCPRCQTLQQLDKLHSLKILELLWLVNLEFILESSLPTTTEFFPSLKVVTLWNCPNLKGWWRDGLPNNGGALFPCISELEIRHCPLLTSIPLYPQLEEKLILINASLSPLHKTMNESMGGSMMNLVVKVSLTVTDESSSSTLPSMLSCPPLSKLKYLVIGNIEELEFLEEKWMRNLNSLQHLDIWECPRLRSLSQGIRHLSSLEYLKIKDCNELYLSTAGDMEWEGLRCLRSLTIEGTPKLRCLPYGLQHVTTLQHLRLYNCASLTALPEWIGSLTLLKRLVISKCYELASLPHEMRSLSSLSTLIIEDCPILFPRCLQETGEDWPKIAHVRNLSVKPAFQDHRTHFIQTCLAN
ncbi:NBS-LRR resistance protein [Quillaja saponaria]|uniref:NBS-LRR resistance protein n=1 Tax=Quillaja saponaria TaxID=32244 RepID=A0AAD7PVS1_QUISA|nr:NBS-LRR resistance protein [Quillaja saponaria]